MNKNGFTLIELIVVMAVFLFVIGAAIGIFISIVQNQERILSQQELLSQMSYAEEIMSKAMRMAVKDDSTSDPNGTCITAGKNYLLTPIDAIDGVYTGIKFLDQSDLNPSGLGNPACVEFYLDELRHVLVESKTYDGSSGTPMDLTSSKFTVNKIRFVINEFGSQPKVTVFMNVQANGLSPMTIQTTVSQRNLNSQP